jgi:hypothetical protein
MARHVEKIKRVGNSYEVGYPFVTLHLVNCTYSLLKEAWIRLLFDFKAGITFSKFRICTFKRAVYLISKTSKFLIASFTLVQTHKLVYV